MGVQRTAQLVLERHFVPLSDDDLEWPATINELVCHTNVLSNALGPTSVSCRVRVSGDAESIISFGGRTYWRSKLMASSPLVTRIAWPKPRRSATIVALRSSGLVMRSNSGTKKL